MKSSFMNMQAEKLQLMKLILETENPKILKSIKNLFFQEDKVDFWNSLTDEQKEEIDLGISEIENGESLDYETVVRKHRK
jgi:hypothetical protein